MSTSLRVSIIDLDISLSTHVTDSEGHLEACKLERNRSNMVMPGMSPSRNATRSKAIRNWALTRGIRLVKSGHGFDMKRKNSKGKA